MMYKNTVLLLVCSFFLSGSLAACNSTSSGTASVPATAPQTASPPAQSATPTAAPTLGSTPEMTLIVVDIEECAQNLGKNTGREHKAKGIILQLTKDQYVEFVRKEMYAYRSGAYPSATDAVSLKCAIRILDYLNQMSPDRKQWLADLFMAAYKSGYEGK